MKPRLPRELAQGAPWITAEGFFDPGQYPLDGPARQCREPSSDEFRHGCRILASMAGRGRTDAGVFLIGLLRYHGQDLVAAMTIVEALAEFADPRCADVLAAELRRLPSSNTTRRYLDAVISALIRLPSSIVGARLEELAADTSFSSRMRAKLAGAASELAARASGLADDGV